MQSQKGFRNSPLVCYYHIIQYAAQRQNLTRSFDRVSGVNIIQGHLWSWQALVEITSIGQQKHSKMDKVWLVNGYNG